MIIISINILHTGVFYGWIQAKSLNSPSVFRDTKSAKTNQKKHILRQNFPFLCIFD
jgi:hypothetical protein